jgi:glycosyltransferase involved in cell wall biosynthesis
VRDAFPEDAWRAGTSDLLLLPSAPLPFYPDIRLSLPNRAALERLAARHRPDLIHCATEFSVGWLGQSLARRRGLPVVTSYHTDFSRYTEAYGIGWLRPTVASHLTRFHQRAERTYTPSAAAAADLATLGVRDVEVWGRGVDTTLYHPRQRSETLRDHYGRRDTFVFLHVGRLAAEKSVDVILRAYARARAQLPSGAVHLVVAGAGPRTEALRAMGTDGITFLGNLDRQEVLPRLYASADAFVFSSVTETLGLVILEAMASGLPVIAAPAGGVADHLRHEVNGLAYPDLDADAMAAAMVALALDRPRAAALGAGARATAEPLDWSHELDRLDASYRAIIARGARTGPLAGPLPATA